MHELYGIAASVSIVKSDGSTAVGEPSMPSLRTVCESELQRQGPVVARDSTQPSKPKRFTLWSFTENLCNPLFRSKACRPARVLQPAEPSPSPAGPHTVISSQMTPLRPSVLATLSSSRSSSSAPASPGLLPPHILGACNAISHGGSVS